MPRRPRNAQPPWSLQPGPRVRRSSRAHGPGGREVPAPLGLGPPPAMWVHRGASGRLPVGSHSHFLFLKPDWDGQAGFRVIPESVRPPAPGATAPSGRPAPGGALGLAQWRARGRWVLRCPRATRGQRRAGTAPLCSSEPGRPPPDESEERPGRWARPARLCCSLEGPQASAPVASGKFVRTQTAPLPANPGRGPRNGSSVTAPPF